MTAKMKFQTCFSLLLMLVFGTVMVSCSDDDGGSLEEPKYEKEAARYTITSPGSPYSSIEFTASGNYLITEGSYNYYLKSSASRAISGKQRGNMFNPVKPISSRDSYDGIIYGKYTVNSDGEYILDGFGKIKVVSNGGTAVDLEITTNSGQEIVVGANRDNIMSESDMTNKLCRTWKFSHVHAKIWEEGKKVFDQTISMEEYGELDDDEDLPENVIFTKSGTYLVTYTDGSLAVSTWRWENENKGILRYSWDYDHLFDDYASGTVELRFDGNKLVVIEDDYDEYDGDRYYFEWFLVED